MVDFGDGAIHDAIKTVVSTPNNWVWLCHVAKSDTKLKVFEQGDDGVAGMKDNIHDGKVLFGYLSVPMGSTLKLVYISFCGEGVAGMKKGLFNQQAQFVGQRVFHPYHVQINARNEDDVDETLIGGVVKKGFGANFHKEYKDQSGESRPEQSTISYESRDHDQSRENAPAKSSITYEKRNEDQSTENAPAPSSVRYDSRDADQSTENAPAPSNVRYDSRDADQSTENKPVVSNRAPPPAANRAPPAAVPARAPPPRAPAAPVHAPAAEEEWEEAAEEEAEEAYEEEAEEAYEEEAEEAYEEAEEAEEAAEGEETVALYAFEGTEGGEQELVFEEGATIWITDKSDPDGYWYGYDAAGNEGYFPSNYTQAGAE